MVALVAAGCSSAPTETGGANQNATRAMKFAACMRDSGVSRFPDPDASGELTVDGVLNGSSLDPDSPAWKQAIDACKDLQPAGFTGHKRSAEQQADALEFAQCMRDNGVEDFPDPTADGPLIMVNGAHSIPGFHAAVDKCRADLAAALGNR
jgi:hypothetical protein